jgi:hypothetical protein
LQKGGEKTETSESSSVEKQQRNRKMMKQEGQEQEIPGQREGEAKLRPIEADLVT